MQIRQISLQNLPQAQKKTELRKLSKQYEEDNGKVTASISEDETEDEENNEKSAKLKDLEASLKVVEQKQTKEVGALEKVRVKIASIVDEPKPAETDPVSHPLPKPDLSALQKKLNKIQAECHLQFASSSSAQETLHS